MENYRWINVDSLNAQQILTRLSSLTLCICIFKSSFFLLLFTINYFFFSPLDTVVIVCYVVCALSVHTTQIWMVGGESWEWTDRQAEVKLKNTLTGNTEKRRHTRWMSVQQERNIHTYFHIIYFQIGYAFRWCSPCLSTALFPIVLIHWYSFCLCVCVYNFMNIRYRQCGFGISL